MKKKIKQKQQELAKIALISDKHKKDLTKKEKKRFNYLWKHLEKNKHLTFISPKLRHEAEERIGYDKAALNFYLLKKQMGSNLLKPKDEFKVRFNDELLLDFLKQDL